MALLGSSIDPRLQLQDYSGIVNAAQMQAQGLASIGSQIEAAAQQYKQYKKELWTSCHLPGVDKIFVLYIFHVVFWIIFLVSSPQQGIVVILVRCRSRKSEKLPSNIFFLFFPFKGKLPALPEFLLSFCCISLCTSPSFSCFVVKIFNPGMVASCRLFCLR